MLRAGSPEPDGRASGGLWPVLVDERGCLACDVLRRQVWLALRHLNFLLAGIKSSQGWDSQ